MYCIIFHYISSWGKRCYLLVLDTTRTDIETLQQKIDTVYQFYEAWKWPFSLSILWHLFSKKLIEINRFLIFCDRIIDFRPEILNNRLIDQSTSPLQITEAQYYSTPLVLSFHFVHYPNVYMLLYQSRPDICVLSKGYNDN